MPSPGPLPPLRLTAGEQVLDVTAPRVVRIGRAAESDLVLLDRGVSRHHAELRPGPGGWVLVDVGGQLGTWVDGERISDLPVGGDLEVRCGPPSSRSTFRIEPGDPAPAQGLAETSVLAAVPAAAAGATLAQAPRSGAGLLVGAEGREHRYPAPRALVVGRHPDCDVVLADATCSRVHGRLDPGPSGWRWTTVSERGAWADGRRVATRDLVGPLTLRLGHPVAGPEIRLVPVLPAAQEQRRQARRRWGRRLTVLGGVAAVAVLVGLVVGAVLLLGGSDRPDAVGGDGGGASGGGAGRLTEAELDGAKQATVLLSASTTDTAGAPVDYTGSGSIVDPAGLVLTNAHVAAPQSEGLAAEYGDGAPLVDPAYLLVSLVESPDGPPGEPEYRARVVAADGAVDAAVLEVYAAADGSPLAGPLDLPALAAGDPDALSTGDEITVLGFPTISGSSAVSVTRGVVSTFVADPVLGPRAEIDTDARIAPGNSGGAAIDDDARIIGIPSALYFQEGTAVVSGRVRPIDLVAALLAEARAVTG